MVAILGFILSITIAAFSNYLKAYRLSTTTRQLASAIQLARMKAVSTNMTYTFNLNAALAPNQYQITGTNNINNNLICEPWEDVFGDGAIHVDTVYDTPQSLSYGSIRTQGISAFPNGVSSSAVMANGTTQNLVFDGRGLLTSFGKQYVLLQNQGFTTAIFIENSGSIHMYRFTDPGWMEFK